MGELKDIERYKGKYQVDGDGNVISLNYRGNTKKVHYQLVVRIEENQRIILNGDIMKIKVKNPIMGVPITFIDKYNPEQFEIVGWSRHNDQNMDGGYWQGGKADATINNKEVYRRILIKHKDEN